MLPLRISHFAQCQKDHFLYFYQTILYEHHVVEIAWKIGSLVSSDRKSLEFGESCLALTERKLCGERFFISLNHSLRFASRVVIMKGCVIFNCISSVKAQELCLINDELKKKLLVRAKITKTTRKRLCFILIP